MYNRYIPRSDGSYSRRSVPNAPPQQNTQNRRPEPPQKQNQQQQKPCAPQPSPPPPPKQDNPNIIGFLRGLLPKEFDTGDLIIVLLLLLMAGDCEEEKSNALLTLALYFLM